MARPQKIGLEYFPFDVDFFDDDKITAVFVEFGLKGEIATIKLLCAIYRNGYFIEWKDSVRIKLLKSLPGVSEELLEKIVNRLVRWDFFDRDLFDSAKVLTSRGIQRRYFTITRRNKRVGFDDLKFLLIEFPHVETQLSRKEIEFPNVESTQSKLNKRKENNKSSISPAPTRRDDALQGTGESLSPVEKYRAENNNPILTSDGFNLIIHDKQYLLRQQAKLSMPVDDIVAWASILSLSMKQQHKNMDDLCKHFEDTLRKKANDGEAPPGKIIITNSQQAKQAWLRLSAIASLRSPEHADTLCSLSFFDYDNGKIQLMAGTKEEAEAAKVLRPLLQECAIEITSSKFEFSFGIINK